MEPDNFKLIVNSVFGCIVGHLNKTSFILMGMQFLGARINLLSPHLSTSCTVTGNSHDKVLYTGTTSIQRGEGVWIDFRRSNGQEDEEGRWLGDWEVHNIEEYRPLYFVSLMSMLLFL